MILLLVPFAAALDQRDAMDGAIARLWGSAAWEYLHGPVAVGDLDGDGFNDTAVGNFQGAAYTYVAGEVQLLSSEMVVGDVDLGQAPVDLHGGSEHDYVGSAVLVQSQGTGADDIVVGADHSGLTEDDPGQVLIWHDPLTLSGWHSAEGADVVVRGDESMDLFGRVVVHTPDLDGDGHDDWVIGSPGRDDTYLSETNQSITHVEAGRAWIVLNDFSGLDGAVNASEAAELTITGAQETQFTGWRACSGGDHDGDGTADLVVGTLEQDAGFAGELLVFTGIAQAATDRQPLHTTDADGVWDADHAGAYAGMGLACGDPDTDGVADVFVGGPYLDAGKGRVWHVSGMPKGREPLDGASRETLGGDPGSGFGFSIALGARLLIGAPYADQVWVGAADFTPDYVLVGPELFGSWVGWPGDVTNDGVTDVVAAAPSATGTLENQGVVTVLSGVDVLNATVPLHDPGTGLDLDGDGIAAPDDCDDVDPTRSPLEDEVCKDGADNDCDLEVDEADCAPGGCATGPHAGWLAVALGATALIGRRRNLLLLPLLGACTATPPLTLDIADGTLAGVVEVTAQGNFDRLALLVDGVTLAGGDGPSVTEDWDTRTVADGEHLVTAVGFIGAADPVEVTETVEVEQAASDVSPPVVRFQTPNEGETLDGELIPVAFTISEDIGLASVEVLANDSLLATIPATGPYELAWENVVNGEYVLSAVATDLAGHVGSASINVVVSDQAPVECAVSNPSYTNPKDPQPVPVWGDVVITARASSTSGIREVEFYADGGLIGTDKSDNDGWSWTWDATPYLGQEVDLSAMCYAADGAVAESNPVTVIGDETANLFYVEISQPDDGAAINGTRAAVKFRMANGNGPDHVELYVNGALYGTDEASPWEVLVDTTTFENGEYVLTAVGYEAETLATAEDEITVTISN